MEQTPSMTRPRPRINSDNSVSTQGDGDTACSTIEGVIIMLISGFLYAVLAALVKWGDSLGYSSAAVLFYRASFQVSFALLTSVITINIVCTPRCLISISFNLNDMILSVKNMNISKHKHKRSDKKTKLIDNTSLQKKNKKKKKHKLGRDITTTQLWIAIACRGMFGAAATFTYFESADLIPIGSTTTLISLSCISASFFGWVFLGDEITRNHVIALFLGLVGAILISQPSFIFGTGNDGNSWGYIIALISALMGGFVYLTIRMAKKAPLFLLITSQGLCCIVLTTMLCFVFDFDGKGFKGVDFHDTNEVICIFSIGLVGFIAQWTLTKGAQKLIAGVSSLLRSSTNMTCAFIFEIALFSTYPNLLTIFGAVIALFAVILVSMEKIRKAQKESMQRVKSRDDVEASYTATYTNTVTNYERSVVERSVASQPIKYNSFYDDVAINKTMSKASTIV